MINKSLAVMLAAFGCAFLYCGSPAGGDGALKWRSSIDIPVNTLTKLGAGLGSLPAGVDVIFDLGADTIPLREEISEFLNKLTDHKIEYSMKLINGSDVDLTLYGLIFTADDGAANMGIDEFYDIVTGTEIARQNRVRLLDRDGLPAGAGDTGRYERPAGQNGPLVGLMLGSKPLAWRWLARAHRDDYATLDEAADLVDIRLRIGLSGANCFDSLLTL